MLVGSRIALAAAIAALPALSGCVQFNAPPTAAQQDVIGAVRVSSTICTSGFGSLAGAAPVTPSPCDAGTAGSPPPTGQYLVGYLVPDGTTVPDSLSSPDLPGVAFVPSASYAAALEAQQAPSPGARWVGYRSEVVTSPTPKLVHVDADFGLPSVGTGRPFEGPLAITHVVGDREVEGSYPADRPVDCSEQRPAAGGNTELVTACVQDTATLEVATRDLSVVPAGVTTVQPGEKAWVPFDARFRGEPDPSATFALAASTDLPGARAVLDRTTLVPSGNGTHSQTVEVAVPAEAAPGDYRVTLKATVGGQTRAAIATLRVQRPSPASIVEVPAPSYPPPAPPVVPLAQSVAPVQRPDPVTLLRRGLPVAVGCTRACTTTVDVLVYRNRSFRRAGALLDRRLPSGPTVLAGRARVVGDGAGDSRVRLPLSPDVTAILRHIDAFTIIVRATSVDARSRQRTDPTVQKLRLSDVCPRHATRCVRARR